MRFVEEKALPLDKYLHINGDGAPPPSSFVRKLKSDTFVVYLDDWHRGRGRAKEVQQKGRRVEREDVVAEGWATAKKSTRTDGEAIREDEHGARGGGPCPLKQGGRHGEMAGGAKLSGCRHVDSAVLLL